MGPDYYAALCRALDVSRASVVEELGGLEEPTYLSKVGSFVTKSFPFVRSCRPNFLKFE